MSIVTDDSQFVVLILNCLPSTVNSILPNRASRETEITHKVEKHSVLAWDPLEASKDSRSCAPPWGTGRVAAVGWQLGRDDGWYLLHLLSLNITRLWCQCITQTALSAWKQGFSADTT